jgi:tetratricopeptide (TPR) repeat protein
MRPAALVTLVLAVALSGGSHAQVRSAFAERQFQDCQAFAAQGLLEAAVEACRTATSSDPRFGEAHLQLATLYRRLGLFIQANSALGAARDFLPGNREVDVVLAELRLDEGLPVDAEIAAGAALTAIGTPAPAALGPLLARVYRVQGLAAERTGQVQAAIDAFALAVENDPANPGLTVEYGRLLLATGNASQAVEALRRLVAILETGPGGVPAFVWSAFGRAQWAAGDMTGADASLNSALILGDPTSSLYSSDYLVLAAVQYGQGRFTEAAVTMRIALGLNPGATGAAFASALPWLVGVLLLIGVALVGESRIDPVSTIEIGDGPRMWGPASIYSKFIYAALIGLVASVAYGAVAHENLLALITPVQTSSARAIYVIAFALVALLLTVVSLKRDGWTIRQALFPGNLKGYNPESGLAIGAGALLAGLLIVNQLIFRDTGPDALRLFAIDFKAFNPIAFLALLALPTGELYFRGYAYPSLARRYGRGLGIVICGMTSALAIGLPLIWLFVAGVLLSLLISRTKTSSTPWIASFTAYVLIAGMTALIPSVRALF